MTLYEIDNRIMECVDLETGEIIDSEALESLQMERESKCENIALWIKNLTAECEAVKNEKSKFEQRQKALTNRITALKKYLLYALQGEKFSTPRVTVSYRRSESVEIAESVKIEDLPLNLWNAEPKPDKTAIKAYLKAGKVLEGITLVESQNIQIK